MVIIGIYPLFMPCVDAVIPDAIGHLFALPDLGAWGLWGLFVGTFLAATVVPFSSDVLYVAMLQMTASPWACLAVATAGNWLGSGLAITKGAKIVRPVILVVLALLLIKILTGF